MENNCLETTLKSVINNADLPYLDYLNVDVHSVDSPTLSDFTFNIAYESDYEGNRQLKIIGDGYFTDTTMTTNLGKTATAGRSDSTSSVNRIIFSNGDYRILIPIKGLSKLSSSAVPSNAWQNEHLDYQRLMKYSSPILLGVKNAEELDIVTNEESSKSVVAFHVVKDGTGSTYSGTYMIRSILNTGRTEDFSIWMSGYRDPYNLLTGATRNFHFVSETQVQCLNEAKTSVLYTGNKVNGEWVFTL